MLKSLKRYPAQTYAKLRAWESSRHFGRSLLVSVRKDVLRNVNRLKFHTEDMSLPRWCFWLVKANSSAARPISFNVSTFLRRHLAWTLNRWWPPEISPVFYRNKRNFLNEVTLRFFFSAYMKLIHRCLELQFIPKVLRWLCSITCSLNKLKIFFNISDICTQRLDKD